MKKLGIVLLSTTLVLLGLLGIKNEYARLLPNETSGMVAAINKKHVDQLFIGSSMFRQGLSIDELEKNLAGESYILSYNGNQPIFIAMELEYMLQQGLEIEDLYIDLYPYTVAATPWLSDTKILLDTNLAFKIETWKVMKGTGNAKFLDFYELFVTANNEQILTYPIHYGLVSGQFRNGGNTQKMPGKTAEYLAETPLLGSRDGIQETQIEGYKKIVELCEKHGINLTFIETPKYEIMRQDADYQELLEACVKELESLEVSYILSDELEFDNENPAYFQDLIHLSYEGNVAYTKKLCERIGN